MEELIEKLKSMKNATKSQYEDMVDKYSYDQIIRNLKEAGIDKDDLNVEEFEALLKEQKTKSHMYAKGAMTGAGIMLFLELLG